MKLRERVDDWIENTMDSFLRFMAFFLGAGILLATIGWMIGWFVFVAPSCERTSDRLGVPVETHIIDGCFYQIDGQWIPDDNLQYVDLIGDR